MSRAPTKIKGKVCANKLYLAQCDVASGIICVTILTFLTLSGSRTFPLANFDPILELPGAFLASRLFLATEEN